jgi:hypothetical protein
LRGDKQSAKDRVYPHAAAEGPWPDRLKRDFQALA